MEQVHDSISCSRNVFLIEFVLTVVISDANTLCQ